MAAHPGGARADCGVFAQDYGQAGAIDFFGRSAVLPPALSGDRTYFLWGPRGYSDDCMIVLDDRKEVLERWENVECVGTSAPNPWALEAEIPVFICRTKKFASWAECGRGEAVALSFGPSEKVYSDPGF